MATNEVPINVRDHGVAVDNEKRKVNCNYCNKTISGFFRLKCHLGGITGDVRPCKSVPEEVQKRFNTLLMEKKIANLSKEVGEGSNSQPQRKRRLRAEPSSAQHESLRTIQSTARLSTSGNNAEIDPLAEGGLTELASASRLRTRGETAVNIEEVIDKPSYQANKCLATFLNEISFDFSPARYSSLQRLLNATVNYPQIANEIPSGRDFKGSILEDTLREVHKYVNDIRDSWPSTGCSILLDGWVDENGRSLVNFLVDCPKGPVYLRSADASASVGDGNSFLSLIDGVVEEVGVGNVVQIVSYSTAGWIEGMGNLLMDKYESIFLTVSASSCLELILLRIEQMDSKKMIIDRAKAITRFIYSHTAVLRLMRSHISGDDLVRPCRYRSAMAFVTLEKMVFEEEKLRSMFNSAEWKASIWANRREGKAVEDLVGDPSFWNKLGVVVKGAMPVVNVLRWVNETDKPHMGYIYETMDQLKETIRNELKNNESHYDPFWKEIDEVWNEHLYSPLHSAGYCLNPSLYYSTDFFLDEEVSSGLMCSVVRLAEKKSIQEMIVRQLEEYRKPCGDFRSGSDRDTRTNLPPVMWWSAYGGNSPELQRLATRILSQTCDGGARYGLQRSLAERLLVQGRNPIEAQKLSDMTFVNYNTQLQYFQSSRDGRIELEEIDPMSDWIVGEGTGSGNGNGNGAAAQRVDNSGEAGPSGV